MRRDEAVDPCLAPWRLPLIGRTLSHYKVTAAVGSGGMGEVYRATDTKLGREVALKVLSAEMARDPERLARFQREARAVAALNHPHIVTIFSVEEADGIHFLTMELVEGQSLDRFIPDGGLPVQRIVAIAVALTDALATAHEKGIVHRDLKPANVMITGDGRVKVLDFGLAKDVKSGKSSDATLTSDGNTRAGIVMGTPAYMSPEQITGREADYRTDIFSLGVVLHEMATGKRPFQGTSSAELASAILRDTPPLVTDIRPDLPGDLAHIVRRCMEKDPSQRFQTAREVTTEFRNLTEGTRTSSGASAARMTESGPSVAVMPFQNLSPDPENEYFSEGLAEEILNALSQVEGLRVAARASSFYFKGKAAEMSEIATRLRVGNLLQGSVRRAGNRVRVTVQLVDVKNGFQLWSERYDRQLEDIFEIQDEIAKAITGRLKVTLDAGAKRATNNLEAYELYLKGRHYWHQRSPATLRAAIQCFEQAIKLDPEYALAYSGLGDCYGILRFYGWISAEAGQAPAHDAMTQAVKLAPALWEVNFSRAFYIFYFERKWRDADPHFEKAIAINPRSSLAHAYYALFLSAAGRAEEAVTHTTVACQLDPLSQIIHGLAGSTLSTLGRFEEAERLVRRALELQPDYLFGLWAHALALCGLGRNEEAIVSFERVLLQSRAPVFVGMVGFGYGWAGRSEDAIRLLHELEDRGSRGEYIPAVALMTIYLGLRDLPGIRGELSKAIAEMVAPLTVRVINGRFLENFRSDPEVDRLHRELFGW